LRKYLEPELKIFAMERKDVLTYQFRFRGRHSNFLLNHLEQILESKNMLPTGFSPYNAPDIEWIKTMILNLEPVDHLGLLGVNYPGWGLDAKDEVEQNIMQINPK
jgi:hypothetical protein